jgi:hypothetical protein
MGLGAFGDRKRMSERELIRVIVANHWGANVRLSPGGGVFGKYAQLRASTQFFAFLRIFFRFWEGIGNWHARNLFYFNSLYFGTLLHI